MFNKSIVCRYTLTLGELLLTTLKMLMRQSRIVINNPIRPATTWSKKYPESEERGVLMDSALHELTS